MQLSVQEVAKLLDLSEKTVYRWIRERKIPAYRVSGQYRFNRTELLEWANANRLSVRPDIYAEPEGLSEPSVGLGAALGESGIYYRIAGTTKADVLRAVIETIRLPAGADRDHVLSAVLAREALSSTGVGHGIAIPHVRGPIVLHIERPLLALCFLEAPIDFDALDGQPVYALFTLVCPTVRTHLRLLSRLGFALRDPAVAGALERRALRDEILTEIRRVEENLEQKAGP